MSPPRLEVGFSARKLLICAGSAITVVIDFRAPGAPSNRTASRPSRCGGGGGGTTRGQGGGSCGAAGSPSPRGRGQENTDPTAPDDPGAGWAVGAEGGGLWTWRPGRRSSRAAALDHEAVLLAVVRHEDDVAVGGPDEPGQPQGVVRAGRGGLHGGHPVGLDAAQLGRRVQHADAPQQGRVHLPERNVAVRVRVGGKVPSIRGKGHCSDWPLVSMDCLTFSSPNVVQGH